MTDEPDGQSVAQMAAGLVAAYVENNSVATSDLPRLIQSVSQAVRQTASGEAEAPQPTPAVSVRGSVKRDRIVCLECGTAHKTLKRHLRTAHGLTPQEYRERYDLKKDYPMTAPDYAKRRSELAKSLGLGIKTKARGKGKKSTARR